MSTIAGQHPPLSVWRAWCLIVLAVMAVGGGTAWYALVVPHVPILTLELAGSPARAQQVIGARTAEFTTAINAGWGVILGYLVALVTATWLGWRVFWTRKAALVAGVALVASLVAAGANAVENVLLYLALHRPAGGAWLWAQVAAFSKFGLLTLAVPIAVLALAVTVGRLVASQRQHPNLRADQVLAAPPLEPPEGGPLPDDPPTGSQPVTVRWKTAAELPPGRDPGRVGICVSGGGIRSACVTLGALQEFQQAGELGRASYLVSVSGGGFMTGAYQLALRPRPRSTADTGTGTVDDPNAATPANVFAAGSVEQDHVRRHSKYLADSGREWAVALGVLLRGVAVSLALVTLTVMVAGFAFSAFYRLVPVADIGALQPRFASRRAGLAYPHPPDGVLIAIGVFAGAALLGYLCAVCLPAMLRLHAGSRSLVVRLIQVEPALLGLALVLALLGVGLPTLVWVSAEVAGWLAEVGGPTSTPAGGAVSSVLLAYLGTLIGVLWRDRQVADTMVGKIRGLLSGRGTAGMASALPKGVVQQLAMGLILGTLVAALLLMLGWAVGSAGTWPAAVPIVTSAIFGLAVLMLDQTWLSLHPFYRRRLASAFSVRRATRADDQVVAAPYDFDHERTILSSYAEPVPGFPRVIFAAAANLSGSDRTPPGRRAVSFTLASDWVGGPDVGWVATAALEKQVHGHFRRDLTVQAAVAISGAAFASAMGRQARAYQTFFALSNARLGAWLPNPDFLHLRQQHGDWRLPQLPRLRRLTYLLREIVGSFPVDDRLLMCTDGGHYENLGLVELLRHRCRLVYCVDASGDSPPFATTLAEAINLAYQELGIEIVLEDPRHLVPGSATPLDPTDPLATLNARLSTSGVVMGRITYPEPVPFPGLAAPSRYGSIIVAKATLTADLPYELLCYAAANPVFPRDSTSDQWFDQGQFDAYHALGRYLGARAATLGPQAEANLPTGG